MNAVERHQAEYRERQHAWRRQTTQGPSAPIYRCEKCERIMRGDTNAEREAFADSGESSHGPLIDIFGKEILSNCAEERVRQVQNI